MPPNFADPNVVDQEDIEDVNKMINPNVAPSTSAPVFIETTTTSKFGVILSWLNLVNNIFSGAVVCAVYIFAFQQETMGATPLHAVLCATGYHLIMGQAILSFAPHNGWTSKIKLETKKYIHGSLLLIGSALAITGSFIKIADKDDHWETIHGKFALVALVFTTVGFVQGISFLFGHKLRRCYSGKLDILTKIFHICCGTVAFCAANVTLCLGIQKAPFIAALNEGLSNAFVAITVIATVLILISPLMNFYRKSLRLAR